MYIVFGLSLNKFPVKKKKKRPWPLFWGGIRTPVCPTYGTVCQIYQREKWKRRRGTGKKNPAVAAQWLQKQDMTCWIYYCFAVEGTLGVKQYVHRLVLMINIEKQIESESGTCLCVFKVEICRKKVASIVLHRYVNNNIQSPCYGGASSLDYLC